MNVVVHGWIWRWHGEYCYCGTINGLRTHMTGNLFSERGRGGEILRITAVEESVDYEDRGRVEVRCPWSRCLFDAVSHRRLQK